MKKILLSAFVMGSMLASAQTVTVRPNAATKSGEGFIYNFSGSKDDNCLPRLDTDGKVIVYPTTTNSSYGNRFGDPVNGLTLDYDSANGYLKAIYDGKQDMTFPANVFDVRFPDKDCAFKSTPVDLTRDTSFTAIIETSVDITLGMILLTASDWADNNYDTIQCKANTKMTFKGMLPRRKQKATSTLKLDKCQGLGIKMNGSVAKAFTMKIFEIKVGDGTTSLSENILAPTSYSVYPNPTKGSFTVETALSNAKVKVFNSNGVLVAENVANTEISNLNSGLYFVEVAAEGKVGRKKLVVE